MVSLPSFPCLNQEEFDIACQSFYDRAEGRLNSLGWTDVRLERTSGQTVLSMTKEVEDPTASSPEENQDTLAEGEIEEEDPETLIRFIPQKRRITVEYDIVLSPTYQVPVLYFNLLHGDGRGSKRLDFIYDLLVPAQYKSELKEVGVMGGISATNHPINGTPTYFVHPCLTVDAMRSIAGDQTPTAQQYIMLWLGVVGNRVGLHVPRELVVRTK